MVRQRVTILFFVLALAASRPSAGVQMETVSRHERSERGVLQGIPVLILRGPPAQRGEAHGALCAREIVAVQSVLLPRDLVKVDIQLIEGL